MGFLLDTHALLWWFTDDARLSSAARRVICEDSNEVYVSAASAWEISTKERLGKLPGVPQVSIRFTELVSADGFSFLPMTHLHALHAGAYEAEHRDPFDRMLAAQSELEGLLLITRDPAFAAFRTRTLW